MLKRSRNQVWITDIAQRCRVVPPNLTLLANCIDESRMILQPAGIPDRPSRRFVEELGNALGIVRVGSLANGSDGTQVGGGEEVDAPGTHPGPERGERGGARAGADENGWRRNG